MFLLAGCTATSNYTLPSQPERYKTTATVDMPKSELWSLLINKISNDFFVINNIDKDSGLINLSYETDSTKNINCGTLTYGDGENAERRKASSRLIKIPFNGPFAGSAIRTYRSMGMSGRINVFVEEIEKSKTKVKVNVRYEIVKRFERSGSRSSSSRVTMNSNGKAVFNSGTICYPTGKLEQRILDLIKNI